MQFLNSIILFGLGAASLPVIIHLLSRRKVKEVAFPSIEFLERMRTDRMRRLRFKQLLALLLRTLIVTMIILAFARPAIRSIFQRNARTAAVVLIDGSASMLYVDNGETLFNTARRKAQEMLGVLGPGDRASIVLAGKEPVVSGGGFTPDRSELARRLRSLECTGGTADLTAAFAKALELLSEIPAPNRELYFLTDGASGALPDSLRSDDRVRLYTILLGPSKRGGAVVSGLEVEERLLAPGKKLTFRASGYAGAEDDRIGVELFVNGERKGRAEAENSGGKFEARFEYTPDSAGWLSVSAVARDGRFEPGETRRLALFVPEARKVLVCGETERDSFFIEKALNPDPEASSATVRSVTAADLNTADCEFADVIILSGVRSLPSGVYRKLLSAVVDRGAGLIVFPPAEGDPALYADGILRDIYPASIEKKVVFDPKQGASYIVWFNLGHPVFRGISERGGFREPTVNSYLRFAPRGNITVLARFADGAPAVGTTVSGKGRAVVFAFDASPSTSDLPLTGLFLPLLLRSVQHVSGDALSGGHYEVGEPLREELAGVSAGSAVSLKPENAPARAVNLAPVPAGVTVKDETADRPGFYSLLASTALSDRAGGSERSRFVVDTPVSEVRFEHADDRALASAFKTLRWKPLKESENLAEAVRRDRYGKELFGWFILGALALMAAEMAVSRKA
jgi:hypothetical protein